MYVLAVITGIVYLTMWLAAGKETLYEKDKARLHIPFLKMAALCYRMMQKTEGGIPARSGSRAVEGDLRKLHPRLGKEILLRQYYVEKLALVLEVILAGTLLAAAVCFSAQQNSYLEAEKLLYRGSYLEEGKEVVLEAEVEGYEKRTFQLIVEGMVPDRNEVDALELEFWEELKRVALGDNPSWDRIYESPVLAEELENYPFTVKWESDSPHILDDTGLVGEVEATVQAVLTATVCFYRWEWVHELEITVWPVPVSEEEQWFRDMQQFLFDKESASRQEEIFELPAVWGDKEIRWSEDRENYGFLIWALAVAAGAGIFFLRDRDLHTQVAERQQLLKEDYPVIVNKLVLYLGAGLTIRGAFTRVAKEYEKGRERGGRIQPAYEEILYTYRELQTGTPESQAYERFGVRCSIQEYIRLGALLSQNLRKGSGTLLAGLKDEAESALREQMNRSRKIGEEASTKLLIPMVMMLAVVMVVIMVPAFGRF